MIAYIPQWTREPVYGGERISYLDTLALEGTTS